MTRSNVRAARHPALSELLARIAADETRERVSIADLLEVAGDRAFGALLFVFALPNVVPTPPGTSALLGLPMVLLAFQFAFGRRMPWLPKVITQRSIARSDLSAMTKRINPVLRRIERFLKPRLGLLVTPAAERILGLMMLLLSVMIFLPIPLGNILPAIAICLIALSLIEHDGLIVALGATVGVMSVLLVWGAFLAVLRTAIAAFDYFGLFGG